MTQLINRGYYLERVPEQKADLPFLPAWQRTSWIEPTFSRLIGEGYGKNAAVTICVQRLALAYQQPRPVVKRADGELLPAHPLQALLNRPNPLMSWQELSLFVATYKAIGGQCYLWKRRNGAGRVIQLWPFHVGNIEVIPGADTWITAYVYDPGDGTKYRIEAEDIVHLKWPLIDPQQPWQALPPLRAMAREVDTDSEATRYMYALLFNDATPRTVVEMPEGSVISDTEYNRMKAQFRMRFGGASRGDVAFLEGGARMNRLALNMEEMAFDALRKVPEARIASGFMIPIEYSGLNVGLEHSTYANVSEARQAFFEDTIVPMCSLDAGELTADLADEFDGDVRVEHDTSQIVALQENQDARSRRVYDGWDRDLLGQRESRRLLGLSEELPSDDTYRSGLLPVASDIIDVTPERPRLTDQSKARGRVETRASARETIQRRIERDVARYLAGEYERAASAIEGMA